MLSSVAVANVNLEWRVANPNVRVGDTVRAELYAVSDNDGNQSLIAFRAILAWDSGALELTGADGTGAVDWQFTGFMNDANINRLNADCGPDLFCEPYTGIPFNDGDAVFEAGVLSLPHPQATPEGLLLITILFRAAAPVSATELTLLPTAGGAGIVRRNA